VIISWIKDCKSKENDEDLSNTANTSELTKRTSRLDHSVRLSNFGKHKLINIVNSGRSKKPQKECRVCTIKKE
jgi:hypothetical protein